MANKAKVYSESRSTKNKNRINKLREFMLKKVQTARTPFKLKTYNLGIHGSLSRKEIYEE